MRDDTYNNQLPITIAIVSIALNMVLAYACVALLLQPRAWPNCAALGSYDDAQASLKAGNKDLDRNHDGIACNEKAP